jgi:hypothetical protein
VRILLQSKEVRTFRVFEIDMILSGLGKSGRGKKAQKVMKFQPGNDFSVVVLKINCSDLKAIELNLRKIEVCNVTEISNWPMGEEIKFRVNTMNLFSTGFLVFSETARDLNGFFKLACRVDSDCSI